MLSGLTSSCSEEGVTTGTPTTSPPMSSLNSNISQAPMGLSYGLSWRDQEDVVISGISGRFPQSDNMTEFSQNLFSATDMVTVDNSRWEPGLYGNPKRHGKVRTWAKFDAAFFGIPPMQVDYMDPQLRNLLHVAYEAICDAGLQPASIRGSRTGVFVGSSGSESIAALTTDPESVKPWSMSGCASSMFANRLSFNLDLRGPSFNIDTACNSSLLALQVALSAMRDGQCEMALVCGANATLTATNCLQFTKLGVLSPDGACRSFDAAGSGYCKSEGIGALLLQHSSEAFRNYATLIHAKSSTDGWKEEGVHFPSGPSQGRLLREVYEECGVSPASVAYLEAHGTGTKVGDPQEVNTIADIFCQPGARSEPLKMGSVKSNMGHAEPASGVASIAKVILAMEAGVIPPNLHYKTPNPAIPSLSDGRIAVCDKPTPWDGGYVGVNSFGFGGANTHVLLRSNLDDAQRPTPPKSALPKLLCFASRTEEGLGGVFDSVENNADDHYFYSLLANQAQAPLNLHPHRGFLLMSKADGGPNVRSQAKVGYEQRPLFLIFNGMGSQWAGMGEDLMAIELFRTSILKSAEVTRELGCDPYSILLSGKDKNNNVFDNVQNSIVCNIAVQVALVDVLRHLGVSWDGLVGHSTGEIACAYADGTLDRAQTMLLAYWRGEIVLSGIMAPGAMAAVGLSWEETERRLAGTDVVAACHNGADSVSISGPADSVRAVVEQLEGEGVFARMVDSSGIPFHSPAMGVLRDALLRRFTAIIPKPKARGDGWVSSSLGPAAQEAWAGLSGPEYHVNNILSPVLFHAAMQTLPEKAVTVEMGGHNLLAAILRRSLPAPAAHIGLMSKKAPSGLDFLLEGLGKLYSAGIAVHFQRLYPAVSWPVPRGTPMINSLIKWDHTADFKVCTGSGARTTGGGTSFSFNPYSKESDSDEYLLDHQIDGRPLFPFTGYPVMAWKAVAKASGKEIDNLPVVFKDLKVYRPTILSKAVKFTLILTQDSGNFEVMEGDSIVSSGNVNIIEDAAQPMFYEQLIKTEFVFDPSCQNTSCPVLKSEDLYKEFLLRGYEYGPKFRGIHSFANDGTRGLLHWNPEAPNWITFLDALLQTSIAGEPSSALRLPVRIRYLRIDPQRQVESVTQTEDGVPVIALRAEKRTLGLVAGGVELRGLSVQTAQRRQATANYFREKVLFVPFEEEACFADFPHVRRKAMEAAEGIGAVLADGMNAWASEFPEILSQPPYGPHLGHIADELRNAGYQSLDRQVDGNHLMAALKTVFTELPNLADPPLSSTNILKEAQKALAAIHGHQDPYLGAFAHPRCMKTLIDIVAENARTHKLRLLMVEPTDISLAKTLRTYLTAHPQIDVVTTLSYAKKPSSLEEGDYETMSVDWSSGGRALEADEAFHVTLLDRVLSKATDIPRYLAAVKQSINEEGFLLVNEVTSGFARNAAVEMLLGTAVEPSLDGARRFGLYLDGAEWRRVFAVAGLVVVGAKADVAMDSTLFLLRPKPETPFRPVLVDCDDVTDFQWVPKLNKVLESLSSEPLQQTVIATSPRVTDNGILGFVNCYREESMPRNRLRGVVNVSLSANEPALDMASAEVAWRLENMDLHVQLYRDGVWGTMRVYVMGKYDAERTETPHAFVHNLVQGDLGSFDWIQSPILGSGAPDPHEPLVSVYFSSLNFRDVMLATGRLSADAIPGDFASRECVLGSEFSGRIASGPETGLRVMGLIPAQALATELLVNRGMCFPVPPAWSMEEAASVPAVYTTVYYALVLRGHIQTGDSVLIHSGSGGVGQAAIAVALAYGAEVFTTVSTPEKKAFLQSRFPALQDRHFANSRTTEFEYHIAEQTDGRGVDIVLNSLSEDKLLASVRCLATFGRFLEIGKFDLANNASLGMEVFLRNIQFHGILVDGLDAKSWAKLNSLFLDGIASGVVTPLPRTVFAKEAVEEAFRFMAHGKHIGKVLVQIRSEEGETHCAPSPIKVPALRRSYCDPGQGYLLSGGLGGFGLQVGDWLVLRGARHLTLTSRSGPRTGYQRRLIAAWEAKGVQVSISKLNIGVETECRTLLAEMLAERPIGGIFHLAMVLRDALFENQTVQNFKDAAVTKYWGTRNLDSLSRSLCGPELRWFVCFSSVSSGRGNRGQTNYGWSNCTMERICEQRHHDGLAGLAIQWGAIGDVGVILNNMGDNNTVVGGTLPQRMPSCLMQLDEFMGWDTPVVSCFVKAEVEGGNSGGVGDLVDTIAHIVGVDMTTLDEDAPLSDLGLDSLMGMEIKQAVERDANIVLSMKEITSLTIKKVKALTKGGGGSAKSKTKEATSTADLQQQLLEIFRLRIDANNCLTNEAVARLNDASDGPNVFFVHTMEGIKDPLMELGAQLKTPAHCLQCTPDTPMDSIGAMAAHYTKAMKAVQPEGPYTVVGYSYGACIAFEIGVGLEAEGQTPTILLLDSSHHYMSTYRTLYRSVYKVGEGESLVGHPNFESELVLGIAVRFAAVDYASLHAELLGCADWASRVAAAGAAVMEGGLFKDVAVFEWLCNSVRARYMAANKYEPSCKFGGDMTLVRAESGIASESGLGDDYGLGEVVTGTLDVVVLPGTHEEIATINAEKTAAVIASKMYPE